MHNLTKIIFIIFFLSSSWAIMVLLEDRAANPTASRIDAPIDAPIDSGVDLGVYSGADTPSPMPPPSSASPKTSPPEQGAIINPGINPGIDPGINPGNSSTPPPNHKDSHHIDPGADHGLLAAAPNARDWHNCLGHKEHKPVIVIVIDDLGYSSDAGKKIVALPGPLTLSFLPFAKNIENEIGNARRLGHEIFMHIPMEPRAPPDHAVQNMLQVKAVDHDIRALTRLNLDSFAGYSGVNNHMGSLFTANARGMSIVLEAVKKRGLVWLDSVTSLETKGPEIAQRLALPWLKRDIFLDHDPSHEMIHRQFNRLEALARKQGLAVAIGHPKAATIDVLRQRLPESQEKGFVLAGAGTMARLAAACTNKPPDQT